MTEQLENITKQEHSKMRKRGRLGLMAFIAAAALYSAGCVGQGFRAGLNYIVPNSPRYDNKPSIGADIGYEGRFNNRLRGEVSIGTSGSSRTIPPGDSIDTSTINVNGSVFYNFRDNGITPYVGAGVQTDFDREKVSFAGGPTFTDNFTTVSPTISAGINGGNGRVGWDIRVNQAFYFDSDDKGASGATTATVSVTLSK
jgi:hypothetical protein